MEHVILIEVEARPLLTERWCLQSLVLLCYFKLNPLVSSNAFSSVSLRLNVIVQRSVHCFRFNVRRRWNIEPFHSASGRVGKEPKFIQSLKGCQFEISSVKNIFLQRDITHCLAEMCFSFVVSLCLTTHAFIVKVSHIQFCFVSELSYGYMCNF